MKAAMEYPLKFGADLQQDIDKLVKYVSDETEKRLAEFFPSDVRSSENKNREVQKNNKEHENSECKDTKNSATSATSELLNSSVQNYLWAHTVVCPHCESVMPLSPNWWLSKTSNYAGKGKERKVTSDWYAVMPIPNPKEKRVDFELIKGSKGKGTTVETNEGEYDPSTTTTISRGVGKCPNCKTVIENEYIASPSRESKLEHQLYAVAYKEGKSSLKFRIPSKVDLKDVASARKKIADKIIEWESLSLISHEATPTNPQYSMIRNYGIVEWGQCFNPRQLLTLITYSQLK